MFRATRLNNAGMRFDPSSLCVANGEVGGRLGTGSMEPIACCSVAANYHVTGHKAMFHAHTLLNRTGPSKAPDSQQMVAPMRMLKTPTKVMVSAWAM